MQRSKFTMSLLENAFDFLEEAVDRLTRAKNSSARNYKYAILNLSSAVELLMKQRLYDEHWSLIFSDVNKADWDSLHSGDFNSVYLADALKRLEKICRIDFSKHRNILNNLKDERNRIEHFLVSIDKTQATAIMVETWSFVIDFVTENISITKATDQQQFSRIRQQIIGLQAYVNQRHKSIENVLKNFKQTNTAITKCPECLQEALPITGDNTQCLFCRETFPQESLEEKWFQAFAFSHMWESAESKTFECSNCGEKTFFDGSFHGYDGWLCLNCGHHTELGELETCDIHDTVYNRGSHCPLCFERWMSQS